MLKFSFLSTVPIRLFLSLSALLQVTVLPAQSPAKPKLDLNITVSAKADQTMYDAAECIDGCLIAVGQTQSTQNSGQDAWLVKIDKKGKIVFKESFGTNNMDDRATAVAELPSGLIVIAGVSTPKSKDKSGGRKAWLRCRNSKGDKVWDRELGEHAFSLQIEDMAVDHLHNRLIVVGVRAEQLWLIITDYTGEKVIDMAVKGQLDDLKVQSAKLLLYNGALYIFGMVDYLGNKQSPYLAKLDANGRELQQSVIFGDLDVVQTGLIGNTGSEWLLLPCSQSGEKKLADFAVIRIDTSLDKSRYTHDLFQGRGDDIALEVQSFAPGQYYMFGSTTSHRSGATKHDFALKVLDSEGKFEENVYPFYPSPHKFEDEPVRCIKTAEGVLWLCGTRTHGSDFKTQTDFWFGRLEQKAIAEDNSSSEPLQPLIVGVQKQEISLLPGENTSYTLTLRNPNNRSTGMLTARSKTRVPLSGLSLTSEIMVPAIPAGATVNIDIPLQADSDAGSGQTEIVVNVGNAHSNQLGSASFSVMIKAFRIELTEYSPKDKAVKGQPCTLRAVFENRGSMEGKNLSLFWAAPPGVTFSGNYQQTIPALAVGQRFETTVTVIPPESFNGTQLELKAFWTVAESDYNVSFPLKFNLSDPEAIADTPSNISAGQQNGMFLIVQWKGDMPEKNTSFEQIYEIKATATSSRALSIEHFKIVLNGDTISYSGQKFDEKPLTRRPRKDGQYYVVHFSKKIPLQPGANSVELIVMNDAGVAQTDIPWNVDYKPNDKGTLYVVSVGIPDKSRQIKYTEQDARDFARLMQTQQGRYYGTVELTTMTGYDSTQAKDITIKVNSLVRENERKTFGELDAVVLFVSGHGYIDENDGTFRIQGSDYDVDAQEQTTVNFDNIIEQLDKLTCNKFVLVDACQAASGDQAMLGRKGSTDDFNYSLALNKLLNSSKKVRSMASCSKGEFSYEDETWQNGAFTYALKQTLGDRSTCVALDKDDDKALSMKELFPHIKTEVMKSVKSVKRGKEQTPSMPAAQLNDDVPFFFY